MTQTLSRKIDPRSGAAAFSLIEVLLTTAIVAVSGLAILSGLAYGIRQHQLIFERNTATRLAAEELEQVKRRLFFSLERKMDEPVIIDEGVMDDPDDDVIGYRSLRFYDEYGNEVGVLTDGDPSNDEIPADKSMIEVRATVRWYAVGRRQSTEQVVETRTLLAPPTLEWPGATT